MLSPAIPAAYARAILSAYSKYGVDPASALKAAHIQPNDLLDDAACLTASQFEALSFMAMRELDDEALGWFSRRLPWGSYGMLCRASISAPDLGTAMHRWARHHRLLTNDVEPQFTTAGGSTTFSLTENTELGEFREFCLVTVIRYALGFACWAINEKINITRATFPFAPPAHAAIYPGLFCRNIAFGAGRAGISFDSAYLGRSLQRDDAALQKMLKRALPLTVLPYRHDQRLATRISQVLRMPNAGCASANDLAEGFHISTRTLHRQLQSEGVSLRQLQARALLERAQHELGTTDKPVKRVAFACGYLNEKAFARAFKQWTGQTPSAFRAQRRR